MFSLSSDLQVGVIFTGFLPVLFEPGNDVLVYSIFPSHIPDVGMLSISHISYFKLSFFATLVVMKIYH